MADARDAVTSYRWEISNFQVQWGIAFNDKKLLISDNFTLESSSIQFALFYKPLDTSGWSKDKFGIILKDAGGMQQIKLDMKIWVENEEGQKFGERSVRKHTFNNVGDQCEFDGLNGNDGTLIKDVFDNHKTLFVCCEVSNADIQIALSTFEFKDKLLQNQWSLFEKGMHDAVIKVGDVEFKISKFLFSAQSPVFESMFTSNFKEGQTSTIDVKDMSEKTMKQLIKWIYSGQIDDESDIELLFKAADKYNIDLLKQFCIQSMISTMNNSNAFERLTLAVLHNNDVLKSACLNQVAKMPSQDAFKCLTSDNWFELVRKRPHVSKEVSELVNKKLKK